MDWFLIRSGSNTADYNMQFDYRLAKQCPENEAFFRLFYWKPYAVSLGFHQDFSEINSKQTAQDNIDIVKRPTGGRAILHAEELTYSVVMPRSKDLSVVALYKKINSALMDGLKRYDMKLAATELETINPDFAALYKTANGTACFAAPAKSELKYQGKKIIGSAQRKFKNSVLQHGSILCGTFHRKLAGYLSLSDDDRRKVREDLEQKTIEIETVTGCAVDYQRLEDSIIEAFADAFAITLQDGSQREEEISRSLQAEKTALI